MSKNQEMMDRRTAIGRMGGYFLPEAKMART